MKNKKKLFAVVVIACLAVGFVLGGRFILNKNRADLPKKVEDPRSKGNKDASVKVVEYVDFQCPACGYGAKFLKDFIEKHPEDLHLELKYFPLKMHPHAQKASRYAECASRQGKFWPFHDDVFSQQKNWKKLKDATDAFKIIANLVDLNEEELMLCLEDPSIDVIIEEDRQGGMALGVRSTPTYIVNGKLVVGIKSLKSELSKHFEIDAK